MRSHHYRNPRTAPSLRGYKSEKLDKPKVHYDSDGDLLYVELRNGRVFRSTRIDGHLGIDYDEDGHVIGYGIDGAWQLIKAGSEVRLRVAESTQSLIATGGRSRSLN